jgi:hypothetical protein
MSRPTLTLEQLVLRPGYVEAMSALHGLYRDSGATVPTLYETCKRGLGTQKKAATVRLVHRLHRLEKEGLVRFDSFAPEYLLMQSKGRDRQRGRPPSGKWVLTKQGVDYWDARLSLEIAKRSAAEILETPGARIHVPQVATPTVLIVNCEPVRDDFVGLRRMLEGPVMGLAGPARQVALQEWSRNPRLIPDWKAHRTLMDKHPRDNTGEYTIPERLALKPWHPAVRGAHRRVERHRMLIVLDLNPAYWDDLPVDQLQLLRKDYLSARKRRALAFARAKKARQEASAPA